MGGKVFPLFLGKKSQLFYYDYTVESKTLWTIFHAKIFSKYEWLDSAISNFVDRSISLIHPVSTTIKRRNFFVQQSTQYVAGMVRFLIYRVD